MRQLGIVSMLAAATFACSSEPTASRLTGGTSVATPPPSSTTTTDHAASQTCLGAEGISFESAACDTCMNGDGCCQKAIACLTDPECTALKECVATCGGAAAPLDAGAADTGATGETPGKKGGKRGGRDAGTDAGSDAGATDASCAATCEAQHPSVVAPWGDYNTCVTESCASACL